MSTANETLTPGDLAGAEVLSVVGLPFAATFRPAQLNRCQRIFNAVIQLANEGGYDAVQMRSVAERSAVSMATLYTYFKSRDNLVYRAAVSWNEAVARRRAAHRAAAVADGAGSTGGLDELEQEVVNSLEDYIANPALLDMYVRGTLSLEPDVVELRRRVLSESWSEVIPQLEYLAPEIRNIAPRLITDTFYSSAMRWAYGQVALDDILEQSRQLVRVLVLASAGTKADADPQE